MATRYRLPDGIRDGEIEAEEIWGGCAGGRPEYQLAGGFTLLAPAGQPLERVTPPPPEEPPIGAVVLDSDNRAWQHTMGHRGDWESTYDDMGDDWSGLNEGAGPLTLLVPDPFAEPVELPLRLVCAATKDDTLEIAGPDDDHQIRLSILGLGSVYLDQRQARTAARALMSAADAAEKEQS